MITPGDIMSTSGHVQYIGGYHESIRGCSVHRDFQYKLKGFYEIAPPHESWNPPDVLMVSPPMS